MGILTDFIIADPGDAPAICLTQKHWEKWPTLQLKNADNSVLAALAEAFGDHAEAKAIEAATAILHQCGDNGPWIFMVPANLVRRIVALPPQERSALVDRWAKQQEMILGGWSRDDVDRLFSALHTWALRAKENNKPLLLWMRA